MRVVRTVQLDEDTIDLIKKWAIPLAGMKGDYDENRKALMGISDNYDCLTRERLMKGGKVVAKILVAVNSDLGIPLFGLNRKVEAERLSELIELLDDAIGMADYADPDNEDVD